MSPTYTYEKMRETSEVAEGTRRSMKGNRASETTPEVRLRHALWAAGIRGYRKNVRKLPGVPDIVFGPVRVVVFVQGCYWHGCPKCMAGRIPKTNATYWAAKLGRNQERDKLNQARLRELGFQVLVIWECELKGEGINLAVSSIEKAIRSKTSS